MIAGETGSGKTTQIPKICLELGRGVDGMIGHTQPRRIAARSVAERVAEELDVPLGHVVGYQVRFHDRSGKDTLLKVMTDGILLSEMQRDPDLRRYDTLIIDEAHERSLNIDFLLGYLKRLLPRRPDLKVVITSATIDPARFAEHFATDAAPVPVLEVSGRTYPVEVRYRPLVEERPTPGADAPPTLVDVDQVTGIVSAVEELWTETRPDGLPQDILVFCSGEREIRDAADALESVGLPGTEVLPLYGRLSAAEQHRVFGRHDGRRIVLATNVAETSLTVPGIRYVVDTGTARISRYSQRTKVQRLPIEPISQASAKQRAGRCGRLADGVCIRLYSQEDFGARPEFTDPEILRTNLASVILQMSALGLEDIERFPFVEPPDRRQISDGLRLLTELQAIDQAGGRKKGGRSSLTAYGRTISRLPVDPRLARMLIAAAENGALREVLVIVAALSIQDPRERPTDAKAQADQSHARFAHEHSDFLSWLRLWDYIRERQKELSGSAFRRMCKREHLHYLRIREWQDLHRQLKEACKQQGMRRSDNPAGETAIHEALLTGLLSHIGLRDRERRDYLGARGARFSIQPGSVLFRRQPDWVMSAELVETSRLWARINARIDPAWVERAAGHLVKRQYAQPHWSRKRESAVASERVTLYGVPLVAGRTVAYGRIDPEVSRDLFIRHALVQGEWHTNHRFYRDNQEMVRQIGELEARARRRDLIVDDETLFEFYDERIPESVVSARHFDSWWKKARRNDPDLLTFTEEFLTSDDAEAVDVADYPRTWHQGDLTLRVTYRFDPGGEEDGVTVHIPVQQLNQVRPEGFEWSVPGLRDQLVVALIKSLPKATRRSFVPAPDHARRILPGLDPASGALTDAMSDALARETGVRVPQTEWDWQKVPAHLRTTFRVEDDAGRAVGEGKDLCVLQESLAGTVRASVSRAASAIERSGLTTWSLGELPETFTDQVGDTRVEGFPALVDHGSSVSVEVLPTASERDHRTRLGIRRLLLLGTTVPWKRVLGMLTNQQRLALGSAPHGSIDALLEDALACAVDAIVAGQLPAGTVRTPEQFAEAQRLVRQQVVAQVLDVVERLVPVLGHAADVRLALERMSQPSLTGLREQLRTQYDELIHPGFVAETGSGRLSDLDRYLRAVLERIDKAPADLARDRQRAEEVAAVQEEYRLLRSGLPAARHTDPDVVALRWMIEELRVSLFAQRLGTRQKVSVKRIHAAMDAVEDAQGA